MKHKKRNIVLVVLALLASLAMQAYPTAKATEADTAAPKTVAMNSLKTSLGDKFIKDDPPGPVKIDAEHFPDANFRAVVKTFDKDNNGELSVAELGAVAFMDCSNKEISDLTGIQYFTKLDTLNCNNNKLTSLNLSNHKSLQYLYCEGNGLTSLNISTSPDLIELYCGYNSLTSLDVSNNTRLVILSCPANKLTSLNLSKNPALEGFDCEGNNLTVLDLSKLVSFAAVATGDQEHVIPLRAKFENDKYQFDFHQIPGVDISKIETVDNPRGSESLPTGVTYQAATGILTVDPSKVDPSDPVEFVFYWYNTGLLADVEGSKDKVPVIMDVIVHLDYQNVDIIYDPAGGMWPDKTTTNKVVIAKVDETIKISDAPTRKGYKFLHWEGSKYQPGDNFKVPKGGHTFVAVWEKAKPSKMPNTGD